MCGYSDRQSALRKRTQSTYLAHNHSADKIRDGAVKDVSHVANAMRLSITARDTAFCTLLNTCLHHTRHHGKAKILVKKAYGAQKGKYQDSAVRGLPELTGPQADPLPTTFTCLFCNHEKSVTVKLDRKAGVGQLDCRICGQKFQCAVNCSSFSPSACLRSCH